MEEFLVLILHGWGSSSKRWALVKEILEKDGISVFVPDLPGFGSEASPPQPWSTEDYAQWVNQWIEKHNLDSFYLVGHSFGGGIALILAAKYPHKIKKLILVSAAIFRTRTLKQRLIIFLAKIGKVIFNLPILSFFKGWAQKIIYKISGVRDYYKLVLKKDPILKETFKKIIKENLNKYLTEISQPTLIIWGDKDKMTPVKEAFLIKNQISNCQLKILTNKGHALNLEAPTELAYYISKFIKNS